MLFRFYEKILLEQVRRGNSRAFAKLYDNYVEKIYRFIYFRTADKETAQDLTTSVFMNVFNYLSQGQVIENFRPFLYRTARNLLVDFYRNKDKAFIPLEEVESEAKSDLTEKIERDLEIENIKKHLSSLADNYQEIIILRLFEDLSFKEIAQITGDKEGNLRVKFHRGLKELKKHIEAKF